MDQNANKVNKFWKGYYEAVVESGIPEKTAEWYANWAQKFAVSIKGTPLRRALPKISIVFWQTLKLRKGSKHGRWIRPATLAGSTDSKRSP